MKSVLFIAVALWMGFAARGNPLSGKATMWSGSKQFCVTGLAPVPQNPAESGAYIVTNTVKLDAAELALTCERVKQTLLQQMELPDRWQRTIHVIQHPELDAKERVIIAVRHAEEGWTYDVHVPETVDREKLVRGVVQALLQEMADRYSPERSMEVPLWLKEGLAMQVLAIGGPDLIAQAQPVKRSISGQFWLLGNSTRTEVRTNSLSRAHAWLKSHQVVSFSDLSMPLSNQLAGEGWDDFEYSAHVFVMQLLKFEDGHVCLARFFQTLPKYYNPQLAFIESFNRHFKSALEVEKWWSVTMTTFLTQDNLSRWPGAAALERLDDLLRTTVEVRTATNALPVAKQMSLQQLIQQTDYAHQKPILQDLISRLNVLELTVTPDQLRLVYDYHRTIAAYLQQREKERGVNNTRNSTSSPKLLVRETVKQLDLLDLLRSDLRKYGLEPVPTVGAK